MDDKPKKGSMIIAIGVGKKKPSNGGGLGYGSSDDDDEDEGSSHEMAFDTFAEASGIPDHKRPEAMTALKSFIQGVHDEGDDDGDE